MKRTGSWRHVIHSGREIGLIEPAGYDPNGHISVAALESAALHRPDAIEVDVIVSSDGVPFIHHHYTAREHVWLGMLPWGRIAGDVLDPAPMTLDSVLEYSESQQIVLDLDIKGGFQSHGFAHSKVLETVTQNRATGRVILSDWDLEALAMIKMTEPTIVTRGAVRGRLTSWAAVLESSSVDILTLDWDLARTRDAAYIHEHGAAVCLMSAWADEFYGVATSVGADLTIVPNAETADHLLAAASSDFVQRASL